MTFMHLWPIAHFQVAFRLFQSESLCKAFHMKIGFIHMKEEEEEEQQEQEEEKEKEKEEEENNKPLPATT